MFTINILNIFYIQQNISRISLIRLFHDPFYLDRKDNLLIAFIVFCITTRLFNKPNKVCIMNATYKEQFKQQNSIEVGLAENWGYQLSSIPIGQKQTKQINQNIPTVANIALRKFSRQIQKTEKIKQVQDEIKALQNERMLRQLREQKYEEPSIEQKSQIIGLMEKLIGDYNHIVEHRHLTEQKIIPEKQQEKHPNRDKDDAKRSLLALIQQKRRKLIASDLSQQIRLNKELALLYRKLNSENMSTVTLKNKSISQQPISQPTKINKYQSQNFQNLTQLSSMNKYQSLKINSSDEQIKQLFKHQSNLEGLSQTQMVAKFKQLQMKRYGKVNRKQSLLFEFNSEDKNGKKNKSLQKTIKSPYIDQKQAQFYKQMQSKIKSNSEALQVWRNKIQDFNRSSRVSMKRQYAQKQSKQLAQKTKDRQEQLYQIIGKQIKIHNLQVNSNNIFAQQTKYRQKQHEQQKEHIFAQLLRKKNNKFNRLWGTKILVKYNSQEQAKLLLKGESDRSPNRSTNTASQKSNRSSRHNSKSVRLDKSEDIHNFTSREKVNNQGNEFDWRGQQKDEEHYWRMCKNEKINLLLKRR